MGFIKTLGAVVIGGLTVVAIVAGVIMYVIGSAF